MNRVLLFKAVQEKKMECVKMRKNKQKKNEEEIIKNPCPDR